MSYAYTPLPPPSVKPPGAVRFKLTRIANHLVNGFSITPNRKLNWGVDDLSIQPEQLHTRILTIHPGGFHDSIEVDLDIVDLGVEGASRPDYEALSYVWGSEVKPYAVSVGKDGGTIPITENLDQALRHLRHADRPRRMWIDALCIDQGSIKERGRQVSYMAHIYWTAPRVVVWLGPGADDSDHAMETLQYIGQCIQVDWARSSQITGAMELNGENWSEGSGLIPLSDRQFEAISALMSRSWFQRVWIRQEVHKTYDHSLVVCGRTAVAWEDFRRGLFCCCSDVPRTIQGWAEQREKWIKRALSISQVIKGQRYGLPSLRHSMVGAMCTDPRDRIYAFLGMFDRSEKQLGIIADYSESNTASKLFKDVAVRYLRRWDTLVLLENCGWDDPDAPSSGPIAGLPTWVPDWTTPPRRPHPFRYSRTFVPTDANADYEGNGVLRAGGVSSGTVQDLITLDVSTNEALATSIRSLVPPDAIATSYPGGGNLWDAFRITLCAGFFTDNSEPPDSENPKIDPQSVSSQDSKEALERIMAGDVFVDNNFLDMVREWHRIGQFFKTREGYLGWGPKTIGKGDQVVNLLGCNLPLVIRQPPGSRRKRFQVLGPCYLHGIMYGEPFLGPLADWIRPILHFDKEHSGEGSGRVLRFHDTRTGETTIMDPRIKAWPFELHDYESKLGQGIQVQYALDPRVWRSLGVKIVDFDLV